MYSQKRKKVTSPTPHPSAALASSRLYASAASTNRLVASRRAASVSFANLSGCQRSAQRLYARSSSLFVCLAFAFIPSVCICISVEPERDARDSIRLVHRRRLPRLPFPRRVPRGSGALEPRAVRALSRRRLQPPTSRGRVRLVIATCEQIKQNTASNKYGNCPYTSIPYKNKKNKRTYRKWNKTPSRSDPSLRRRCERR